jgi:hypothetical protein
MKKIWMYGLLVAFWAVIAVAVVSGGEGVSIWRTPTVSMTVTDTCYDTLGGVFTDGDSGAHYVHMTGADFATWLPGDSLHIDTAAFLWPEAAHGHTSGTTDGAFNDSGATTLHVLIAGGGLDAAIAKGFVAALSTVTFDTVAVTGHPNHSFVRTIQSVDNDSSITLATALPHQVMNTSAAGWEVRVYLRHATIYADVDSVSLNGSDSLYLKAPHLTHTVTGWHFWLQRGGEITTVVDTGEWFFVPKAHSYDIHMRCVEFSQKDSVIAQTKLQSKRIMDDIDQQPVNICSSAVCTDTTLAPANFCRYPFLDSDGGPDTAWANGGFLGVAFRFITTVVDSESRPAYYGRHDMVRFLNVIEARY